jgi:hypothetical protein
MLDQIAAFPMRQNGFRIRDLADNHIISAVSWQADLCRRTTHDSR